MKPTTPVLPTYLQPLLVGKLLVWLKVLAVILIFLLPDASAI
jgi:hypothetical protein